VSDQKRFDDYTAVVDCNECAHYWDSSCDGASKGSIATCNSFSATRSVVIPRQIKQLQTEITAMKVGYGICIIALAIGLLAIRLGWF
jgi:hypothetical protein